MELDGKKVAQEVEERVRTEAEELRGRGVDPTLAPVLVGRNPGAVVYFRQKRKLADKLGINFRGVELPEDATEGQVLRTLAELGQDTEVHGVFVELPLPKHIDFQEVAQAIPVEKDVDCIHPASLGQLFMGGAASATYRSLRSRGDMFFPTTAQAVMELLLAHEVGLVGKEAVVVGGGAVGLPLSVLLLREGLSTVTVCDRNTPDLAAITRRADVLCVAVGRPKFIRGDMIREGVVVIDVGINPTSEGIVGDVDFASAREVAGYITPVPGGVGPVTTALIMAHTIQAAKGLSS
jgi:methylenetetrahydrofolate dehydrogenase (NADP+)/methenyltetrahydrofolate cyclohydrolase